MGYFIGAAQLGVGVIASYMILQTINGLWNANVGTAAQEYGHDRHLIRAIEWSRRFMTAGWPKVKRQWWVWLAFGLCLGVGIVPGVLSTVGSVFTTGRVAISSPSPAPVSAPPNKQAPYRSNSEKAELSEALHSFSALIVDKAYTSMNGEIEFGNISSSQRLMLKQTGHIDMSAITSGINVMQKNIDAYEAAFKELDLKFLLYRNEFNSVLAGGDRGLIYEFQKSLKNIEIGVPAIKTAIDRQDQDQAGMIMDAMAPAIQELERSWHPLTLWFSETRKRSDDLKASL